MSASKVIAKEARRIADLYMFWNDGQAQIVWRNISDIDLRGLAKLLLQDDQYPIGDIFDSETSFEHILFELLTLADQDNKIHAADYLIDRIVDYYDKPMQDLIGDALVDITNEEHCASQCPQTGETIWT